MAPDGGEPCDLPPAVSTVEPDRRGSGVQVQGVMVMLSSAVVLRETVLKMGVVLERLLPEMGVVET